MRLLFGLLLVCLAIPPGLVAQEPGRPFVGVHAGTALILGDSIHASTVGFSGRLTGGLQLRGRIGLEASAQYGTGWKDHDVLVPQLPVAFDLYGGTLAGVMELRMASRPVRLRLGAGGYRVRASPQVAPDVTVLGLEAGIEVVTGKWPRGRFLLGVRPLLLPNVHGELVWLIPVELGIRLW